MHDVSIELSWKQALLTQFEEPYWHALTNRVRDDYKKNTVYPKPRDVFRAFDHCPLDNVKVVIVGQDPYHGPNQAHGLCFSVNDGIPIPPSLKNIFKEIRSDLGITPLASGDLTRWSNQGVLLLNSVLTVLANRPGSHAGLGWERFTDAVIHVLNEKKEHIVYMLWGKYAQAKGTVINRERNLVLESGHPSPFSATLFHGKHHFSQCNEYLKSHGLTPIDWR